MLHPRVSEKRARSLATALFFVILAIVIAINYLWPGILIAIGVSLAFRQALLGHFYDSILSLCLFLGGIFVSRFAVSWRVVFPVIFFMGAFYILLREYMDPEVSSEPEREESLNKEIEEEDNNC